MLRALAGGLIGAATGFLLASMVPLMGFLRELAVARAGPAYLEYALGGLLLLVAGAALSARVGPGDRRLPVAAAALAPLLVAAVSLVPAMDAVLTPGVRVPEPARLLVPVAPVAAVAAALVVALVQVPPLGRRWELPRVAAAWLLGAVLLAFGATVALGVAVNQPFSWDEAVYALTSRHWVHGTPITGWGPHRPLVLSVLGMGPALAGGEEWSFRAITAVLALGAPLAAWFLARSIGGELAGLLAAAGTAAVPTIAMDAGQFLNDVPATALVVLTVTLVWRAMESGDGAASEPVPRSILWAAPVAAAAFYVRYGSIVPLLALALAAAVTWPRRVRAGWPTVLATIGLVALLLAPHAAFAMAQTGSPLGIVLGAQSGARPAYPGEALLDYLDMLPGGLAGVVPGVVMLAGLAATARRLAGRGLDDRTGRALVLLLVTAGLQLVVLGVFILPQARYIFVAVVLLVVAGSVVVAEALASRGRAGRAAAVALAAGLVVTMAVNPVLVTDTARAMVRRSEWQRQLGRSIAERSAGSCAVLLSDVPQMTWYSGCAAYNFGDRRRADRAALLDADERYLVVRSDGVFQPPEEIMARYLAMAEPEPVATVTDADGDLVVTLYRLR